MKERSQKKVVFYYYDRNKNMVAVMGSNFENGIGLASFDINFFEDGNRVDYHIIYDYMNEMFLERSFDPELEETTYIPCHLDAIGFIYTHTVSVMKEIEK